MLQFLYFFTWEVEFSSSFCKGTVLVTSTLKNQVLCLLFALLFFPSVKLIICGRKSGETEKGLPVSWRSFQVASSLTRPQI